MTINPHLSDQLAAEARNADHHPDCIVPETVPSVIDRLLTRLPGVDPHLLGEIVMHTADAAEAMVTQMARRGIRADGIPYSVTAALGEAGSRLYRGEVAGL